ncbi:MAG: M6 family metalloprotease domain-containing protein [Bacteroidetes bacterium]|nr:M6 family metalloprotease domain-containing protein [Bacteroidota bacterium]
MKNILQKIVALSLFIFCVVGAYAIPPKPGAIVINKNGVSFTAFLHGDEFFHWATLNSEDGEVITCNEKDQWVYAELNSNGEILPTNNLVGLATKSFSGQRMNNSTLAIATERANKIRPNHTKTGFLTKNPDVPTKAFATEGTFKGCVILVEFPDLRYKYTQADMNSLVNEGTKSAAAYFTDSSMDKLKFSFDVYGPVMVSQSYSFYGGGNPDRNPNQMIAEACDLANKNEGVDFTKYDQDKDGKIDMVFVYFAGHNEAEGGGSNHIWPHKWNVWNTGGYPKTYDGKTLDVYACSSELSGASGARKTGIGTFCHEFSHVLGLMDVYDTDYQTNGQASGMGAYSLMCSGGYNGGGACPPNHMAFEKVMFGWLKKSDLTIDKTIDPAFFEIKTIAHNEAVVIKTKVKNFDYYLEYRKKEGWDKYIPAAGVLAYFIDQSSRTPPGSNMDAKTLWAWNKPVSIRGAECAKVLYANNQEYSPNGWLYPRTNNKNITPTSSPNSKSRYDSNDSFTIRNIKLNGETATMQYGVNDYDPNFPLVNIKVPAGGFTASTTLELLDKNKQSTSAKWFVNGVETTTLTSGKNVEIKAVITMRDNTTSTVYKITDVK